MKAKISSQESSIESWKSRYDGVMRDIEVARKESAELKRTLSQNKEALEKSESFSEEMEKLKKLLEAETAKANSKTKENELLKSKIKENESSLVTVKNELKSEKEKSLSSLQNLNEALERESALMKRVSKLENELSKQEGDQKKSQNEALGSLKKDIEKLQEQVKELDKENEEMRTINQKETAKFQNEVDVLQKKLKGFEEKETAVKDAGARLKKAREEMDASLSCSKCLKVLSEPVTAIPCGHCFCFKCRNNVKKNECPECPEEDNTIEFLYRNKLLDEILEKYAGITSVIENYLKVEANTTKK